MPFNFLVPPDPPAFTPCEGGSSGIVRMISALSSVVIVVSFGKGTGFLFGSSIVQLSAIVNFEDDESLDVEVTGRMGAEDSRS